MPFVNTGPADLIKPRLTYLKEQKAIIPILQLSYIIAECPSKGEPSSHIARMKSEKYSFCWVIPI